VAQYIHAMKIEDETDKRLEYFFLRARLSIQSTSFHGDDRFGSYFHHVSSRSCSLSSIHIC